MTEAMGAMPSDRFAAWPRLPARFALLVLAMLLLLAAWAPGMPKSLEEAPDVISTSAPSVAAPASGEKDNDLRLYRLITDRVAAGENYYKAATEQQRTSGYPVAPGLTVRLPTLAFVTANVGQGGIALIGVLLGLSALLANYRRFAAEPGGDKHKLIAVLLLFLGLSSGLRLEFAVLHEVWAGALLALSFGLHRPDKGKWVAAWLAAAAALAVRELALPYVLLMAAFAFWHGRRREGAAWSALAAMFGLLLWGHLLAAEMFIQPGDDRSPGWLVFGGISGLLYKVIHSSVLSVLPQIIAGPLVILAMFGWCGWRSPAGGFASLLTLGYGMAFMIAGRDNNFYWGVILVPILFVGLAFAPASLTSLVRRARG